MKPVKTPAKSTGSKQELAEVSRLAERLRFATMSEACGALCEVFGDHPRLSVKTAAKKIQMATLEYALRFEQEDDLAYQATIELQFLPEQVIQACRGEEVPLVKQDSSQKITTFKPTCAR